MTDTTSTEHAPTAGPGAADLIQLLHSISATQAQMLAYIEDRRRTTEGTRPLSHAAPPGLPVQAYDSGNARDDAQIQLERLQQGSRSAEEYFTESRSTSTTRATTTARSCGSSSETSPRLLEAIYNMNTLPDDDDFKGWKDLPSGRPTTPGTPDAPADSNTSRPLDFHYRSVIDVVTRERQHIWDLLGRRRPNGDRPARGGLLAVSQCYNCHQEGHLARNCPHSRSQRVRLLFAALTEEEPTRLEGIGFSVRQGVEGVPSLPSDDTLRVSTTSDDVPRNSSSLTPSTMSDTLVTPESHINLAEDPTVTLYDKLGRAGGSYVASKNNLN
ncbi:hypothetical protein LshimejAT787_2200450 [Lyophyllum shimeji]|uniref:CCHC-type domain-containing protein n=1 Tax=Lyophyllum shimeji TaxID=47721 RepID=A0A9P3PYG6_LYOSH|nr:hypothetical protein LshimejAT787_2200450 [Lyophyllum shimeji]